MSKHTCSRCLHFIRHYGFAHRGFFTVHCGHCMFPHIKQRAPDTPACKFFVERCSDEE